MQIIRVLTLSEPLAELDDQIEKFKGLVADYRAVNRKYYGEYLSRILYDEDE
jgi:hypothetical protein